jgi:hypothetical protein
VLCVLLSEHGLVTGAHLRLHILQLCFTWFKVQAQFKSLELQVEAPAIDSKY